MERLTSKHTKYECRMVNCPAEAWMEETTGFPEYKWEDNRYPCDDCPFMAYINRLAEYEDKEYGVEE